VQQYSALLVVGFYQHHDSISIRMSRRKSAKAESPALTETALRGPLSQPNNQAFLAQLRNMPEFAQSFQMVHLFKRALQVAEPVEIEVLEEELITCDFGRLTRQITWALIRAHMRIKKKQVDDVELWNMAKRVWEGHREEWEEEQERLRDASIDAFGGEQTESSEPAKTHTTDSVNGKDDSADHETSRDLSHDLKRSPSPIPSPPAKRTRSTRSRAKAEAEAAQEEQEKKTAAAPAGGTKSRDKSRVKKKGEPPQTPEVDKEAELAAAAAFSRDLDQRNHLRKLIIPDLDFNPFADSPTLVSSFSRFTAFQLVKIWYQLIQWIFDHEDKSRELVETTLRLTDYKPEELRSEPLGNDSGNHVFYLFGDSRLYKREERTNSSGFDVLDLDLDTWSCVCATWEDWEVFMAGLESRDQELKLQVGKHKGKSKKKVAIADVDSLKYDSELYGFFSRDVMPVVSEVFVEKARSSASRDKERLLEAAMATRKTSSRIQALQAKKEEQDKLERKEAESRAAQKMERKRLERIELQRKQMEERQLARERRFERRNGNRDLKSEESAGAESPAAESRDRRRQPPRRAAAVAAVTWTFDCVCGIHGENYEDDKAMIECETCKTWMHIECLRDRRNVDTESFECDVCGSREEREARAREKARVEEEKAEKKRRAEEERAKAEEEKARLKKEKNAARWQERKKRMKEKKEQEARERESEREGERAREEKPEEKPAESRVEKNDSGGSSFQAHVSPQSAPIPQQFGSPQGHLQPHSQPFSHQGQEFQSYAPQYGHQQPPFGQQQFQAQPPFGQHFTGSSPMGQLTHGHPQLGQGQFQLSPSHVNQSVNHASGNASGLNHVTSPSHVTHSPVIQNPLSQVAHHPAHVTDPAVTSLPPVTNANQTNTSPSVTNPMASPAVASPAVASPTTENGNGHVTSGVNGV
jgi:hypothetical protein